MVPSPFKWVISDFWNGLPKKMHVRPSLSFEKTFIDFLSNAACGCMVFSGGWELPKSSRKYFLPKSFFSYSWMNQAAYYFLLHKQGVPFENHQKVIANATESLFNETIFWFTYDISITEQWDSSKLFWWTFNLEILCEEWLKFKCRDFQASFINKIWVST